MKLAGGYMLENPKTFFFIFFNKNSNNNKDSYTLSWYARTTLELQWTISREVYSTIGKLLV